MHAFRDNKATFLLATPAAARGLDLPAVSHVYNLSPPADAIEYLHRAGRVGRIGANVPGPRAMPVPTCTVHCQVHALEHDSGLDNIRNGFSFMYHLW